MCINLNSWQTVSFFCLLLLLSCGQLQAQNYSLYNSFYVNPYLYNPAEAATSHAAAFVNYRKQWISVDGAPTIATINYNTQIDHSRAGFGMKASTFSRGLLNTSEALLSYTYGVPFSEHNVLYFGISGGGISNSIDISKASDPNDPALASYSSGFQPSANFGLKWASPSGISVGAVLPQLFGTIYSSEQRSKTGLAPFNNMLFTFSFRKQLEQKKSIRRSGRGTKAKLTSSARYAPLELYFIYRYSAFGTNQYEGVGKLNLSDNFWLSLGYRQQYGIIPSLGFAINNLMVNYSYELGSSPQNGFSMGSHEFQIGVRFGKEKQFKFKAPVLRSALKTETTHHDPRFRERTADQEEAYRPEDKRRYYIYVKSFATFDQAEDLKRKLHEQKFNGQIYFHARNKQYYVYTFESANLNEANQELKNLKTYTKLKDVKLLTVIEK